MEKSFLLSQFEEHLFTKNFEKIVLNLNVPDNELCLRFQEFLRRLKIYLLLNFLGPKCPSPDRSLLHAQKEFKL